MRIPVIISLALLSAVVSTSDTAAQAATDSTAIRATALNYIEGRFTGNPDRMEQALHPELVKRIIVTDETTGRDWIYGMGITKLVEGTRKGFGKEVPEERRRTDVTILDITGRAPAGHRELSGPTPGTGQELVLSGKGQRLRLRLQMVAHRRAAAATPRMGRWGVLVG